MQQPPQQYQQPPGQYQQPPGQYQQYQQPPGQYQQQPPMQYQQPPQQPVQQASAFPCSSCGAAVSFMPGTSALQCPYCGSHQEVPQAYEDNTIDENDYEEWLYSQNKPRGFTGPVVVSCPCCAAQVSTTDLSLPCPFCNAAIVLSIDPSEQIIPEGIIPFTLTHRQASEAMQKWAGSRWFAPNALKKVTNPERINGSYIPHWTYDAETESGYMGMRGDYYYVTETYTDSEGKQQTRQVRRTNWTPTAGHVRRDFDDVLVIASRRLAPDEVSKLAPWTLSGAEPFQPGYMAGSHTLRYDVEPDQGLAQAKEQMAGVIKQDCREDIGGDEQRVMTVNTSYDAVTFKLMLLPVWVAGYLYAGKTYTVYINAHTGAVVGARPYSVIKILSAVLAALLVLGIGGWLYFSSKKSSQPTRPSYGRAYAAPATDPGDPLGPIRVVGPPVAALPY